MQKKTPSESGIFHPRVLLALTLCLAGCLIGMFSFAGTLNAGKLFSKAKASDTQEVASPDAPAATASGPGIPRYYTYAPGPAVGEASGEPSIGYNPMTKRAMYIAGLQTLQITFPENIAPPGSDPTACPADWKDVSFITEKTRSLDPILFTDQVTGRTFVSQLNSVIVSAAGVGLNSLMAFSDTDGEPNPNNPNNAAWTQAQLNAPDGSNDHQTVGTGPYPLSLPLGNPVNNNRAVYYCGQQGQALVATSVAVCSRSDDGGLNFGKSLLVYPGAPVPGGCSQLVHGHVKVAPDGTAYLPNATCQGHQAVAVSTNGATTWTVHTIPDSLLMSPAVAPATFDLSDPSVGIASDGTVYFAYTALAPGGNGTDNHIFVSVSHNQGQTWSPSVDLGANLGIKNAVFAVAVAGDPNRAAVGFLGTTQSGDHQSGNFAGTWYGYVAHTYDGGATWTVVNASGDPVQREACIWNSGGNNVCRNLLDFNDITMDEKGRVLFGYADGCIGDCATGNGKTLASKATIARQSGGKTLLSAFDAEFQEPVLPQRACLTGYRDDLAAYLKWTPPDNGGSDLTAYYIYRSSSLDPQNEIFVGQAVGSAISFNDRAIDPTVPTYTYRIIAANALGSGQASNAVSLVVGPRIENNGSCTEPGVQVITDPAGDETSTLAAHDITSINVAEPKDPDPNPTGKASNIIFTIKVASFRDTNGQFVIPPGWRWSVRFQVPGYNPPAATGIGPQEDWHVSMVSSDGASPCFSFGTTGVPAQTGTPRLFSPVGTLDPSSSVDPDGTIRLVLPKELFRSKAVCSVACQPLAAGQSVNLTLGSVRASGPCEVAGAGGTNETIPDITGASGYTLRPVNLCLPNNAPIAVLNANVSQGLAPLAVTFDGSASSDADTGIDTIASYTFNFNDGSDDVTQTSPTINHTFMKSGQYLVKLVVTDSRGKVSSNTATFLLDVQVPLTAIASRKTHGGAGDFDINLPLGNPAGIECRTPGANNSYNIVYKFSRNITNVGSATKTQGTGTVGQATLGTNPNEVVVNVTNVTNAQHFAIKLDGARDSAGAFLDNVPARMDVLIGDGNGSGIVTSGDTNLCKAQALQPVTNSNFRMDINASGSITTGDVNLIKQHALDQLPP